MRSKAFRIVIFLAVLVCSVTWVMKFYKNDPSDEDVVKNFALNKVEERKKEVNEKLSDTKEDEKNDSQEKIDEKTNEVVRIHKGEKLEAQGVMDNDEKEPAKLYSALSADTINVVQDDNYLTNKYVLVEIKGTGPSSVKIGDEDIPIATESGSYSYVCKVSDNVEVKAGSASKTVKNIVTVSTGVDGGETNKKYIKDKTNTTAIIGGKITGASDVTLSSSNIKEHGVRYWRSDNEDEVYTVKTKDVGIGTGTLKYEVKVSSLKENTTYYMQAYMINNAHEVILGDVKEFATRGQGTGLYRLCYDENNKVRKIKQERKATMNFSSSDFTYKNKVKWVGEIVPVNNGVMHLKVTGSGASGSIKISNGTTDIYASDGSDRVDVYNDFSTEFTTSNIYEAGKRYPIVIDVKPGSSFKIEWKEDGQYQEIPREQLYPKEYTKILSAVINSVGTDNQMIDKTTGKLIGKKVTTKDKNMNTFEILYTNDNASGVKIDSNSYTIGENCIVEGCIIYNTNGVFESITENVTKIDYGTNEVTLRNGSKWTLYAKEDGVDIVGRVIVTRNNGKAVYNVYDLGRYITNYSNKGLSDGSSNSGVYRADEQDKTYILDLCNKLNESKEYQAILEQYGTMERLVEDSKPVRDKWNTGIGDARLFSQVPIRVLLSFDGDTKFEMKNPVIKISKELYKNKFLGSDVNSNILFKNEEEIKDKDNKFKLALPTNAETTISKDIYANWRYMSKESNGYYVEGSDKHIATMTEDDKYIYVKLNEYSTTSQLKDDVSRNVVMLNFVVRLNSIENKTSKEIFEEIKGSLINDAYVTYTKAVLCSMNDKDTDTETDTGTEVEVVEVPIKIKIKPQVVFE